MSKKEKQILSVTWLEDMELMKRYNHLLKEEKKYFEFISFAKGKYKIGEKNLMGLNLQNRPISSQITEFKLKNSTGKNPKFACFLYNVLKMNCHTEIKETNDIKLLIKSKE